MDLKLYKTDCVNVKGTNMDKNILIDFQIVTFKPGIVKLSLNSKNLIKNFLWFILTAGRYRIIYVLDSGKVAHTSYLIPKNIRFPFMKSGDIQIGPCFTYPGYRNQGIYTETLKFIISNFCSEDRSIWIYTRFDNYASQKAIEHAGFQSFGSIIRSGILKIMRLKHNVS